MCRNVRPWLAGCLLCLTALIPASPVQARTLWECLTGKKPAASGSCNSPSGQCGTAGAAAPGTTQPYMVPIGPPRYVPAAPGAQPGAPSLSPTGASLPASDPAFVSRPVWPAMSAAASPYAASSTVPQTTYYQQPAPAAVSTVPAGATPVPRCASCQQQVAVSYAPYTAYSSRMIQVPTTVYRPVTTLDPVTGAPVTVLQPCQTTTTQVQRVPATLSRSYARAFRPLPVKSKPAPVAMTPAVVVVPNTVAYAPVAPVATGYVPYASPYVNQPYAAQPYISQPYISQPYISQPYIAPTYSTVPASGYSMPTSNIPAGGGTLPSGPVLGTPAAPSGVDPADLAPTLRSSPSGGGGVGGNSGASFRPSFPRGPADSAPLSGTANPVRASDPAPSADENLRPVPSGGFPLRPIPTPEAEESRGVQDRVPQLIQPAEDRTAQQGRSLSPTAANGAPARAVQPTNISLPRRADDSGWRSLQ